MSWEDEDFEVAIPAPTVDSSKWADEDKEEVKESWEDEDEEQHTQTTTTTTTTTTAVNKGKSKSKSVEKGKGKKGKEVEKEEVLDPEQQKLRQQRLVEEADMENTKGLFSGLDSVVDTRNPKDEKDFEVLAEEIAKVVTQHEKSFFFKGFLKTLFRHSVDKMKPEEIKELASALTIVANEKMKAEKGTTKKKKSKKASLNIKSKDKEELTPEDDFDDYADFM